MDNLRDLLAELTSTALHYQVACFEGRTDKEYREREISRTRSLALPRDHIPSITGDYRIGTEFSNSKLCSFAIDSIARR